MMKAATKTTGSNTLPYPCLIFNILKSQGFPKNKKKLVVDKTVYTITNLPKSDGRVMDLPYAAGNFGKSKAKPKQRSSVDRDVGSSSKNILVNEDEFKR